MRPRSPTFCWSCEDLRDAGVVAGVDVVERLLVIAPALPGDLREVDVVVHAEVMKRREQPAVERVPEPQLDGDPAAEPVQDRLAIRALRRRGETEENLRAEVVE